MYLMHLVILHYYNVTWLNNPFVDIWEDLDNLRFLQHGEYLPQVTSSQ
jgi:hypothetical protein